jgi:hypothetical protein
LDSEGADAFGSLVGAGEAGSNLERKVIVGRVRETSPSASVEGIVGNLFHIVLEHPEDKINHYAILELQDFGGGGRIEDDVLECLQKIKKDRGA